MADNKKNKNGKGFGVTINISWVLYAILIIGLGWMLFSNRGTSAEKVEWEEVKTMILSGDVDEIVFVRNDYQGDVKIRPERLAKYSDKFPGGVVPRKSPHFYFLTSTKFDPETTFSELNESLDPGSKVKIVMRNNDHAWGSVLEWILWPILMILLWVWMFRGLNRSMGGGAGGMGGGMGNPPMPESPRVNSLTKMRSR